MIRQVAFKLGRPEEHLPLLLALDWFELRIVAASRGNEVALVEPLT